MSSHSISRKKSRTLYFSRTELSTILSTYAARVASSDWRDYALDHIDNSAIFSIFKHAHEQPLFTIEKQRIKGSGQPVFILKDRKKTLYRTGKLPELTNYLYRLPRLIQA